MSDLDPGVGLELECVLWCPKELVLRKDPDVFLGTISGAREATRYVVGDTICQLLNQADIPCVNKLVDPCVSSSYHQWVLEPDSSIKIPEGEGTDASSVKGLWIGIEIISRILDPTEECVEEVGQVLSLIKSRFRLANNKSTGLHVHVGNGNRGFALSTLKKFSMLVTAFESLINTLHPSERLLSQWCRAPSRSADFSDEPEMSLRLLKLEQCASVEDLVAVMNPNDGRECAYNLTNLRMRVPGEEKLTIEFRQHEGSVNLQAIVNWTRFAVALVEFSHKVPESQHLILCVDKSKYPAFTIFSFLVTIGRHDLIDFYRQNIFDHDTPEAKKDGGRF
ncbi:hypothetical protein MMC30_002674 [Trapelia coarctata]|nr:hypothetical protein [Trapelia coarctata]